MRRLRGALLLPCLAACTAGGYAVVPVTSVPVDADEDTEATAAQAALVAADTRLRAALPGLRAWRSCDDVEVVPDRSLDNVGWRRWVETLPLGYPRYVIRVSSDRAAEDRERDFVHAAFEQLRDGDWDALPDDVLDGVADAAWAGDDSERVSRLVADAALALDAGIDLVVAGQSGPVLPSTRRLLWWSVKAYPQQRPLREQLAMPANGLARWPPADCVGTGAGPGLDWLLARQLLERLGAQGLHELGTNAGLFGVRHTEVFEAAGLAALDESSWRSAVAPRVDAAALAVVARAKARELALPVLQLARAAAGPGTADELLERTAPQLRAPDGATLPLAEVPEFVAVLRSVAERVPEAAFSGDTLPPAPGGEEQVADAPPARVQALCGVVRAADPQAAQRIAALLDDISEQLRAMLPGLAPPRIEVWLLPPGDPRRAELARQGADAQVLITPQGFRILLAPLSESSEPLLLAHELAHVLIGPDWTRLGGPCLEGLAEYVGMRFEADAGAASRCSRLFMAAEPEGGVRLQLSYVAAGPEALEWRPHVSERPEQATLLDARSRDLWTPSEANIGRALVLVEQIAQRIGLARLLQVCAIWNDFGTATAPQNVDGVRLLDDATLQLLAGVRASGPSWRAILERLVGEPELRVAATIEAHWFAERVAREGRAAFGALSADEFVERADVRLAVFQGASVRVADVPAARLALVEAWQALGL